MAIPIMMARPEAPILTNIPQTSYNVPERQRPAFDAETNRLIETEVNRRTIDQARQGIYAANIYDFNYQLAQRLPQYNTPENRNRIREQIIDEIMSGQLTDLTPRGDGLPRAPTKNVYKPVKPPVAKSSLPGSIPTGALAVQMAETASAREAISQRLYGVSPEVNAAQSSVLQGRGVSVPSYVLKGSKGFEAKKATVQGLVGPSGLEGSVATAGYAQELEKRQEYGQLQEERAVSGVVSSQLKGSVATDEGLIYRNIYKQKQDIYQQNAQQIRDSGPYNFNTIMDTSIGISKGPEVIRTLDILGRRAYRNLPLSTKQKIEERTIGFLEVPSSLVKGVGKIVVYDPAIQGTYSLFKEGKLPSPKKEQEIFQRYTSDPDIFNVGLAGVAAAVSFVGGPWVAGSLAAGFFGKTAIETYKEPTNINIGRLAFAALPIAELGARKGFSIYKKTGATYVPPEKVFAPEVIKGQKAFPTSTSAKQTIKQFEQARTPQGIPVVSATEKAFAKQTTIGAGIRARKNLEDVGLYVTPVGRGSPYFLRVPGSEGTPSIKILPEILNPQAILLNVEKVQRLPPSIRYSEGFEATNQFLYGQAGQKKAYVTKRSEGGFDPQIAELNRMIAGVRQKINVYSTTELEAVIPPRTEITRQVQGNWLQRFKGYTQYTVYRGEVVPLLPYKITGKVASSESFAQTSQAFRDIGSDIYRVGRQDVELYKLYGIAQPKRQARAYERPAQYYPKNVAYLPTRAQVPVQRTTPPIRLPPTPQRQKTVETPQRIIPTPKRPPTTTPPTRTPPTITRITPTPSRTPPVTIRTPTPLRAPPRIPGTPKLPPTPPTRKPTLPKSSEKQFMKGFDVFVRTKGQFTKVNERALTRAAALGLGTRRVTETSAATFVVRPSRQRAVNTFVDNHALRKLAQQFRTKVNPRTGEIMRIEKTRYRISTPGELQQITEKGIKASRMKRRRKK